MKPNRILIFVLPLGILFAMNACRGQTQCNSTTEFAYIGKDNNIYLYNVCTRQSLPLTEFMPPPVAEGLPIDYPKFYEEVRAWSANGNYLLAGSTAGYLIDLQTHSITMLGAVEHASWSPSGRYLSISTLPDRPGIPNGTIFIIDPKKLSVLATLAGYAPIWKTDEELFYLPVVSTHAEDQEKTQRLFQQAQIYNLQTQEDSALPMVVKPFRSDAYVQRGQFSPDQGFVTLLAKVYGDGWINEGATFSLETSQVVTSTLSKAENSKPFMIDWWPNIAYQWSPTSNVLALCSDALYTGGEGPKTSQMFLVGPDRLIQVEGADCYVGDVSWRGDGQWVAYNNAKKGVGIIDNNGVILLDSDGIRVKGGSIKKTEQGIWLSPHDDFLGVNADGQICIAPLKQDLEQLEFECVVKGSRMAWRPS